MTSAIKRGANHVWLPYTQMQNHLPQLEVETTKGSDIFLKDGRVLIDGISSWWSVAHGYNHPHLVQAIKDQADKLPHIMLAGFANDQTYELAYRLCQFCNMDKVFFSDSGSVAVEVAMKMAWQYHMNKKQKQKTKFVSFKNSYHGDSTGAMSLADLNSSMHEKFKNLLLKHHSVSLPKTADDLDQFEDFIRNNQHELAAIFVEPLVQCAGGMQFGSPKILKEIYAIAKKYDILFIADECAVGFYRTGKKFACDHADISPDILIIGKALTGGTMTLAATLVKDEIYNAFLSDSLDNALMHGPTFMGNPLACAAANASLDLFVEMDYATKVHRQESIMKTALIDCTTLPKVKNVRTLGAIGVVEMDCTWDDILRLRQDFVQAGVFLRPFANCVYLMPALTIEEEKLMKVLRVIKEVLSS